MREVRGRCVVEQFAKVGTLCRQRFDSRLETAFVDEFAKQRDQLGTYTISEIFR